MDTASITDETLLAATAIAVLSFTAEERALMLKGVQERVEIYEQLRGAIAQLTRTGLDLRAGYST